MFFLIIKKNANDERKKLNVNVIQKKYKKNKISQ